MERAPLPGNLKTFMTDAIKTKYKGVEISYDEGRNLWCFSLRGNDKTSGSLELAKQAIDKPAPKDKSAFTPFNVWKMELLGDDAEKFLITGIADGGRYSYGKHVWVKDEKGKRSKERFQDMFIVDASNDALVAEIRSLNAQISKLQDRAHAVRAKLVKAEYPAEE